MQTALHRKDGLASEETPAMPNLMSSIDKWIILKGEHLVVNFKGQLTPQGKTVCALLHKAFIFLLVHNISQETVSAVI